MRSKNHAHSPSHSWFSVEITGGMTAQAREEDELIPADEEGEYVLVRTFPSTHTQRRRF